MIKKALLFIVSSVLILSCSKEKKQEIKQNPKQENIHADKEFEAFKKYRYFDYDRVTEAKYKVLKDGDKFAYAELELFFSYNKSKNFELLPYSIIMVQKHKKYGKCTNVFDGILQTFANVEFGEYYNGEDESLIGYLKNVEKLSNEEKDYAISYLKLGARNDDYLSVSYLEVLYRNGFGVSKDFKRAESLAVLKNDIAIKLGLHLSNKHN
ncbi:hypothetical protein EYY60_07790 [Flavobacterium zhairuonense]|uniref:hypothetical protein n=1 Tax=Flavobacterium zhairuonense TaxID=2493631 RepID=UPI001053D021|nr:hypothetical protein [Flavobacterium zhairuonense]KAF2512142.1 hypothetical protein EYY60_07790 [Flavobacterium zhairuonense]